MQGALAGGRRVFLQHDALANARTACCIHRRCRRLAGASHRCSGGLFSGRCWCFLGALGGLRFRYQIFGFSCISGFFGFFRFGFLTATLRRKLGFFFRLLGDQRSLAVILGFALGDLTLINDGLRRRDRLRGFFRLFRYLDNLSFVDFQECAFFAHLNLNGSRLSRRV